MMIANKFNDFHGESLIDLLAARAIQKPTDILYRFLPDSGDETPMLHYAELEIKAKAIAVELAQYTSMGDRVLLIYPPGLELITAYFGCLYAGLVAVPVYPPLNLKLVEKLQRIIVDATPSLIISTQAIEKKIKKLKLFKQLNKIPGIKYFTKHYASSIDNLLGWDFETLRWVCTDILSLQQADNWQKPLITGEHLAFLQYTSGSTGWPKGVMVSHHNLLHNLHLITEGFSLQATDSIVGWLPPYHDMGLIGNILTSLYVGIECILLSPFAFLQRPARWLQAMSDYRATISGGPNFSYDYCTRKITDQQCLTLNLAHWQLAFNGAEPIHSEVMERFAARFKSRGFNKKAFYPCYGLAEATLFVAGARRGQGWKTAAYSAPHLQCHEAVTTTEAVNKKNLTHCGFCAQNVRIINPHTQIPCQQGEIGEIWIQGDSVAKGYWGNAQATQEIFAAQLQGELSGHYLRTGDLGCIKEEGLFVTGRIKDLIIIHGVNHYPQDIEYTLAHCHAQIRPGCCAAFSITVAAEEHLAVVCEVDAAQDSAGYESIGQRIGKAVAEHHELAIHTLALIAPKSLPKTTSGKIRRRHTKALLQAENLNTLYQWTLDKNNITSRMEETVRTKTVTEMTLLEIYQVIFAKTYLHLHDNFFNLGGDSLTAMQLVARVRETWDIELDPHLFFKDPSVAEVARIIENSTKSSVSKSSQQNTIPVYPRDRKIPLSFSQQRLWFLHQLHSKQAFYNLPTVIQLNGLLDVTALEQAIGTIIVRHEILRTAFPQDQGQPYQQILPATDFQLLKKQFSDGLTQTAAQQMQTFIKTQIAMPFDLSKGNLLRAYLLSADAKKPQFILLFVIHHIITDGWSLGIFAKELGQLYNAYTDHLSSPLKPLDIQYADYSQWQRVTQSALIETQLTFWKQRLQDAPTLLQLPTDKPRPAIPSYQGENLYVKLTQQTVQTLKAIAQQQGCSLHMVLLTIFEVLLYRYTQQTDLVIGSAVAHRHYPEVKNLIGFFVNTLALRTKIADTPTSFLTQLAQTRQTVLDALANQEAPFDQVVQSLDIARNLSVSPLIQVMFVLQNKLSPQLDLKKLHTTWDTDSLTAKFDLTLECIEENESATCRFEYATDLFEKTTIQRMAQHFLVLAEMIAMQPTASIQTIGLLDQEEAKQILDIWNATGSDYPQHKTIHQLFEEQVNRTPDDIAVEFEGRSLTYRALNESANRLAHYLRNNYHIKGDDLIALCLDRNEQMLIAILAVLKAGAAYVPMDPSYPEERINYILVDTQAKVVLTNAPYQSRLGDICAHNQQAIPIEALDNYTLLNRLAGYGVSNLNQNITSEHLAYVIYTSGTTGQPKGVMIAHKSVANLVNMQANTLGLSRERKDDHSVLNCLWYANYVFDAHVWELFAVICAGHRLHIAGDALRKDVTLLSQYLAVHKIHMATLPPALLGLDWLPSLHTLIVAGEKTEQRILAYYKSQQINIINAYGPTEATVCATFNTYQHNDRNSLIGKPVANTTAYILDAYLNPLPVGAVGELHIGGAGLARGYLNLPELTAERFITNPFQTAAEKRLGDNARLYKTGDLARYLPDGHIEYRGRNDSQVKIRGVRIELSEIETKLVSYPDVKQVVVLAKEAADASNYNKYLVAYYVADNPLEQSAMLAYLHRQLPDYMVPRIIVWLAQLPLTLNGKLDRKALPVLESCGQASYQPACNAVEKQLVIIWREVLKRHRIGVNDNFFEAGGHSLLGVQLVQRIEQAFKRKLPVSILFTHPTIKAMGELCLEDGAVSTQHKTQHQPLIPLKPTGDRAPLFIVYPVGGQLRAYQKLSQYLPASQPLYGLQHVAAVSTITFMAEIYIHAVRKIQAVGPYYLAGWSMGGVIAHEMAYQLEQAGQLVNFVGLIDSVYENTRIEIPDLQQPHPLPMDLLQLFCNDFWKARNGVCSLTQQDLAKNSLVEQLSALLIAAKNDHLLPDQTSVADVLYSLQQSYQNAELLQLHHPKLIKSNIVLFNAALCDNPIQEKTNPCSIVERKYTAGKIFTHEVTADHYSILQIPGVLVLIHFLEQYLKFSPSRNIAKIN